MDRQKWIGLAEVYPTPDCVDIELPAFVTVVGMAWSGDDFIDMVRSECAGIGMELVDIEDVETWEQWIANWQPEAEVCEMANSVSEPTPFAFGTFVTFPDEDETSSSC